MTKKVQLIRPNFDDRFDHSKQLNKFESPPVGLAYIAKAIKTSSDFKVEIYDGLNKPNKYISQNLGAEIVGMQAYYSNISNGFGFLKEAKEKGAITVLGGPYVNNVELARNIYRNRKFIDYIVIGDGREAMIMIAQGVKEENIR